VTFFNFVQAILSKSERARGAWHCSFGKWGWGGKGHWIQSGKHKLHETLFQMLLDTCIFAIKHMETKNVRLDGKIKIHLKSA